MNRKEILIEKREGTDSFLRNRAKMQWNKFTQR